MNSHSKYSFTFSSHRERIYMHSLAWHREGICLRSLVIENPLVTVNVFVSLDIQNVNKYEMLQSIVRIMNTTVIC